MYLLYINEIGTDFKNQKQYEFIFGENIDFLMEDWFDCPASGKSVPPDIEYISSIGLLKDSDLILELIQNSDFFSIADSVFNIVALGWVPFNMEYEKRTDRLHFDFGEEYQSVVNKLKEREIKLIIQKIIQE